MSKIQFRNQQDNQQDDIDIVQLMDRLNSNRADFDNQTGQSIQILSAAVSEQQKDVHGMTKKQGPRKMAATKATGAVVGLVEQNKNTVDLFSAKKVSILEFAHIFNNLNKLKKDEKNVDVSFIASNFLSLIENGQDNFVIAAVKKMRDNEFSKLADAVISQARAVSLESDETYKNKLDKFVSDVEVPLVKQTGMVRFAAADRVVTAAEAAAKMSDEKKAKPSRP